MSDAASTSHAATLSRHFLLRRLHSLTGIVPIGVFLINHLLTNSSVIWGGWAMRGEPVPSATGTGQSTGVVTTGAAYFWHEVKWINEGIPHLMLVEITLWASILFHSVLGVMYARSGKSNVAQYAYQDNWRYTLQRISGYVGIAFIFYHVATLRWGWSFLVPGGTRWNHHYAASTLAAALRGGSEGLTLLGLIVSLFYLAGVSLLVFHFANGLWTAAITWGLTISRAAQRRWGYACLGLGAAMMVMGWASVLGFLMLSPAEFQKVERAMLVETGGAGAEGAGPEGIRAEKGIESRQSPR